VTKKELQEIAEIMDSVLEDFGVPRNIKRSVTEAKKLITKEGASEVECTSAVYILDESLNDINMPTHTRTELMEAISKLEKIKEQLK